MTNEAERDDTGYDDWYGEYEADECDHESEIDWEGRAHCHRCGEAWWASAEEVEAQDRHMREYAEWEASQHQGRIVWWHRTIVGFVAYLMVAYGPRFCCDPDMKFGAWCLANSGDWVYRAERYV